jgi:DNA-binding IclR family transcriptional regulator
MEDDRSGRVKSVEQTVDIAEYLLANDGGGVSEIADDLGVAKSTVSNHLRTLESLDYVVKEDGEYRLGTIFIGIGDAVRERREIYAMAGEKTRELAAETGERALFTVEEHGRGIYVHRERGSRAIKQMRGSNDRNYLHSTASGKAMLAHFPQSRVDAIVDRWGLPELTEQTTTDRAELERELETIRDRGFALNREEAIPGLRAVGVAVHDPDGSVIGAFSVSGPSHRLEGEQFAERLPNLLLGTANEFDLNLSSQH